MSLAAWVVRKGKTQPLWRRLVYESTVRLPARGGGLASLTCHRRGPACCGGLAMTARRDRTQASYGTSMDLAPRLLHAALSGRCWSPVVLLPPGTPNTAVEVVALTSAMLFNGENGADGLFQLRSAGGVGLAAPGGSGATIGARVEDVRLHSSINS